MNRRNRRQAWGLAAFALAIAPLALAGPVGSLASCSKGQEAAAHYHCPMHPTYVSDTPGDCPICGMRLVPIATSRGDASAPVTPPDHPRTPAVPGAGTTAPAATRWTCPMEECGIHTDQPGKCPRCGMDLVRENGGAAPAHEPPATGVPGLATVETTGEGRRLAGVQTAVARRERIERTIRAVGTVVADETRIRHVHTKIAGWVDELYVDFTGQAVRKGMPILSIYSQELLASQEEYLRAREAARRFEGSSLPEIRKGGEDLVQAARRRLQLFDVPKGFIDRLERTGKPVRNVPVQAPWSGIVTAKQVYEGQQVEPGMELFTITDLSHVWIEAELYENEVGKVRVGDEAVLSMSSDASVRLAGRVKYVLPYLSPDTRTQKVRFDVANPDGALKPAMYADVQLTLQAADGVVVPDSAVMDTGLRQVVFVEGEKGAFEPREIRVGLRSQGRAQILEGLKEGERVAVAANFLLDSESRLRSALGSP